MPGADLTGLLQAWSGGDAEALDQLAPLVHRELREMARRLLSGERSAAGVAADRPRAGVVRAPARLADGALGESGALLCHDRADDAPGPRRSRRVRDRRPSAGEASASCRSTTRMLRHLNLALDVVALENALEALAAIDPRPSQVVELRFFGGFSVEETAETLGVSVRTVINDWNTARAWLHRELATTRRGSA